MARRKKLNWGAFGSEALMGFGEGMQGWGQMTQERERYQTSEAGRMLDRLADQHTRTRGREEDVPAILKSVEEQYPHAKSEAWDSIMKAATLTPGERQDIFAESLRELGPDASQEQLEQIYTSANFKEPWQAHPERTMAPDQYGPPIEGYAPGGDVSKAQGMLSGLQEQAGRGEERAIDVAARTARVTQQPQKISIVHTGDDGEEFPAILMLRQSPDGEGYIGEIVTIDGKVLREYQQPSQIEEMLRLMGVDGFNLPGRNEGDGEPLTPDSIFDSGDRDDAFFGQPTGESKPAGTIPVEALKDSAVDAITGAKDWAYEQFMPSEDDFGHPNWSEVPRDLTDPARAAAFEALGEVNQEYQHFMKMVEALDDPRALPGMQASLGRLMGYLNNPNTRALFTDEGVQRILELTKYFPAGMAHEAFTGGAQGGRSTPSPFPPSSTGRPGPNLNDPMLTPGAIAPNVDPPDVMTTGTLGPQPQRTPTRGLLPSSSQQLPPLTGGQTVAPRPRLTAPLPSGGQPLSPLTPRPSMPPGLPQPGTGRPDLQWPPPTPREPFPPDVPRMTQRPQGPPRFDLERALPRPASPPVLPRIEGGLDQLPAPPPGMPGYTSEESITVRPEDPGGVTVQPPVDISVPEITPVNPEWDRIKRNTRGGWEANNYQLPEEQRERVDHNVENILGGNVSYQVRQAVTNWLESQIYVESRGRSQAESKKDAIGLMQVISDEALADVVDSPYWDAEMQADWDALGTGLTFPTDLTGAELKDWMNVQHPGYRKRIDDALLANPDFSLEVGTNYLKVLAKKPSSAYNFQNAPSPLVATILAYHQGGSTVRKWIDSGAAGDMQRNPETLAFDGIDTSDHSIIGPEGWDYVHNVMNQINPAEEAIINDLIRNQWRYR